MRRGREVLRAPQVDEVGARQHVGRSREPRRHVVEHGVEIVAWLRAGEVAGQRREVRQAKTRRGVEHEPLLLGELEAALLVGELAHGQRQLVEIGIVLAHKPWLVLLDEPAAGITSAEIERLVSIIKKVNHTATMIVVDHDMQFVRMLNAPITVFHQGAILIEGPGDKVLTDPQVREVYLGRRSR